MRKKLILGNWKMNKTRVETAAFAADAPKLSRLAKEKNVDIGVCPAYLSLETLVNKKVDLIIGAQNVSEFASGAYTGEVSIPMLLDLGVTWSLVGHSERRSYYNENDDHCNEKVKALLKAGMTPVYCVGETLAQFESGKTRFIVEEQIRRGLAGLTKEEAAKVIVAYEPVWSIGTGKNASVEIAQNVCHFIRELLVDLFEDEADTMRILYGGSVKPDNIKAYFAAPDIDGALVGGASLSVDSFYALINNA